MRFGLLSLVLAACASAACGGSHAAPASPTPALITSPTPAPAPAAKVTLAGRITESPPTPTTGIDGAVVTIRDGSNAGRFATANPLGFYSIADLEPGAFTVTIDANDYVGTWANVACSANLTSNFQLLPVPKTITHTLTGDVGGSDGTCSDSISDRPCRIVVIPIHNVGPVEAVLSWTPTKGADLDLTLFQTGVAAPLARSASAGAGPEQVNANLTVGATYEFHITYAAGVARATYTLRVTHMN